MTDKSNVEPIVTLWLDAISTSERESGNLAPPGSTVYVMWHSAGGSRIANQSKQAAYATVTDTFLGWPIPL